MSEGGSTRVHIAATVGFSIRKSLEKMELTSANLAVEVTLKNLMIEMFVVFCVTQKIIAAHQYQKLPVCGLLSV